jgi:hypothetical protein
MEDRQQTRTTGAEDAALDKIAARMADILQEKMDREIGGGAYPTADASAQNLMDFAGLTPAKKGETAFDVWTRGLDYTRKIEAMHILRHLGVDDCENSPHAVAAAWLGYAGLFARSIGDLSVSYKKEHEIFREVLARAPKETRDVLDAEAEAFLSKMQGVVADVLVAVDEKTGGLQDALTQAPDLITKAIEDGTTAARSTAILAMGQATELTIGQLHDKVLDNMKSFTESVIAVVKDEREATKAAMDDAAKEAATRIKHVAEDVQEATKKNARKIAAEAARMAAESDPMRWPKVIGAFLCVCAALCATGYYASSAGYERGYTAGIQEQPKAPGTK